MGRQKTNGSRADWEELGRELPPSPDGEGDLLWREYGAYLRYYDREASRSRIWYQVLKLATVSIGALLPVLVAIDAPAWLLAVSGAAIVVLEGAQQVFQFHANWLSYRAAAESLRLHGHLYAAEVAPYVDRASRRDQLAELMRLVTSQESSSWQSALRHSAGQPRVAKG